MRFRHYVFLRSLTDYCFRMKKSSSVNGKKSLKRRVARKRSVHWPLNENLNGKNARSKNAGNAKSENAGSENR